MLVLTGTDFPSTAPALLEAINGGLSLYYQLPPGRGLVELTGDIPHFARAVVNLTDAATTAEQLPPDPRGTGQQVPAFDVAHLELSAQPMRVRGAPLSVSLSADNVSFDYDRDPQGRPVLLPRTAQSGQFSASIAKADLQSLILSAARQAGEQHGIAILDAHLDWTQLDPQTVALAVNITARKLVKAQITLTGQLTTTESMALQLSKLECTGTGMIATLACAAIRPRLQQLEGQSLDLDSIIAGSIKLHDVNLSFGDSLTVRTQFG